MTVLTDPFVSKKFSLKNRLVMPPMATGKSDDGKVSKDLLAYYDEKTKGGKIGPKEKPVKTRCLSVMTAISKV